MYKIMGQDGTEMDITNIYAMISLYNPDKEIARKCKTIAGQVDKVFLCDNSRTENRQLFEDIYNAVYTANYANLGLPGAFNKILKDINQNWKNDNIILFFDQDSEIEAGYIGRLMNEFECVERDYPNLGCLGPIFFNTSNGIIEIPKLKTNLTGNSYKVKNIITSSMAIRYGNLKKMDFWNENLFLDFVDWDLCWRMEKKGFFCCITDKVVLRHSVGEGERKIGPFSLRVGQPIREYYQTRDALYLLHESYVPFKMRLRLLANATIRPIVHILFLNSKRKRMKYIGMGFRDYKKGMHGELKEK